MFKVFIILSSRNLKYILYVFLNCICETCMCVGHIVLQPYPKSYLFNVSRCEVISTFTNVAEYTVVTKCPSYLYYKYPCFCTVNIEVILSIIYHKKKQLNLN